MKHLLDTSAILAHYLGEPGAERVQALFEDDSIVTGASILSFYEVELRLHQLGVDQGVRTTEVSRFRALLSEVVDLRSRAERSDTHAN